MVKDGQTVEPKTPTSAQPRLSGKKSKQEDLKEDIPEVNIEEEIKNSNNVYEDEDGTKYSCHFHISKKEDGGEAMYNGYTKKEILNPRLKGLHLYERVSYPRFKLDSKEVQEKGKGTSREAFEAFLEIIKCPV